MIKCLTSAWMFLYRTIVLSFPSQRKHCLPPLMAALEHDDEVSSGTGDLEVIEDAGNFALFFVKIFCNTCNDRTHFLTIL